MKMNQDYKSRFRILKGGKISLVISGVLLSASLSTPLLAAASDWAGVTLDDTNATYTLEDDISTVSDADSVNGIEFTSDIVGHTTTIDKNVNINLNAETGFVAGVINLYNGLENSSVINNGSMLLSSPEEAAGILIYGNMNTSSIDNSGTITIASEKNIYSLEAGGLNTSSITNSGNITAISSGIDANVSGIYIDRLTQGSNILNSGTMNLSGNQVIGINFNDDVNNTIAENKGTMTLNGGSDAIGIITGGDNGIATDSKLINSGAMDIKSSESVGIWATKAVRTEISNTGKISLTSDNFAVGLGSVYISDHSILSNSGDITIIRTNDSARESAAIMIYKGGVVSNSSLVNSGSITLSFENNAEKVGGILSLGSMEDNSSMLNTDSISLTAKNDTISACGMGVTEDMRDNTTIQNSGTIDGSIASGLLDGIYASLLTSEASIVNNGDIVLSETNATDVDASAFIGIAAGNMEDNATMSNNKLISLNFSQNSIAGYAAGFSATIYNSGSSLQISNSGRIEISAKNSSEGSSNYELDGMFTGGELANDNVLSNSGTIAIDAETDRISARGIYVESLSDNAALYNSGTISINATGTDSPEIRGIEAAHLEGNATILNSGNIAIDMKFSGDNAGNIYGIKNSDLADNTLLQNSGSISISTDMIDGSTYGIETDILDGNASLQNSGSISINRTALGENIGIKANSVYADTSIQNSGIVSVTGVDNAQGIYMSAMVDNFILENSGVISVKTTEDPYGAVGIYLDAEGNTTARIENSGTIISNGYSIYAETAVQTLNNSGLMSGVVYAPEMIVNNNAGGTMALLDFNSSVVGTFNNEAGSTLQFGVSAENNGSISYAKLVTKDIVIKDNSTIDFKADSAFIANTSDGDLLTDVISAGTLDMNTSAVNITDNSLLVDFEAIEGENALDFKVKRTSLSSIINSVGDTNADGVAEILEDAMSTATGEMRTYLDNLVVLPTAEALNTAVQSVTPVATAAAPRIAVNTVNGMSSVVQGRQNAARGFNSGDALFSDKHIWFKPFGSYTKQDNSDGKKGFSANTYGFGFGMDGEYSANKRVGLSLFYAQSNADTNDVNQESDADIFTVIAYGDQPIVDDKTTLFYQAGYTYQNIDSTRDITAAAAVATATYNTESFLASANLERVYALKKQWSIRPSLKASYQYLSSPSYSESGAGNLDLNVEGFHANSFIVGAGSTMNYAVDRDFNVNVNMALDYDFNSNGTTVNSSFQGGGAVFATQGINNDPFIYNVGVGMDKNLRKNFSFGLKYDFSGRGSSYQNHAVYALFTYKLY